MGASKTEKNGTNGHTNGDSSANGTKKPRSMAKKICCVTCGPVCLYFTLLGFSPFLFEIWLEMNSGFTHTMPLDAPVDITDMEEVTGVHTFADMLPYTQWNKDRPIIFRNFTDCASTFESHILPRRAKQVDAYRTVHYSGEHIPGNVYAKGIRQGPVVHKSLEDTINDESPNEYASFLRIFDHDDYRLLMNTTWDYAKKFKMDTSFISHFSYALVSSNAHAASMTSTFSLQCYGYKAWLFWSSQTLNKYGHYTAMFPAGAIISGTPQSIIRIPTVRAVVGPGDLMFFPPLWYHAVMSSAGKNIMFALRQLDMSTAVSSFRTSSRDSLLWLLRTIYDKPRIFNTLTAWVSGAKSWARGEKEDHSHRLGFNHIKVSDFHEKGLKVLQRQAPREMMQWDGLEYFGMPPEGYVKTGKEPGKIITPLEHWEQQYEQYGWEWLTERIAKLKAEKAAEEAAAAAKGV